MAATAASTSTREQKREQGASARIRPRDGQHAIGAYRRQVQLKRIRKSMTLGWACHALATINHWAEAILRGQL